ncbi:MAG TPA: tyrosinase family protein [Thermoanaerobaculia bacterium]|nr:tyrosinase family protein [Thermoanaerobaculia bacterium]
MIDDEVTRRSFLQTTMVAAGAAALPLGSVFAQSGGSTAKYTRYNVMSPQGQKALASYAKGVAAMLALPPTDPQNWFRNAFTHLMDCPHGNWWFYVWHRGYVGYFEERIRNLSGDPTFAMPYWDWTTLPQIPDSMFDGPLDPQNRPFEPYTSNLAVFTSYAQPALQAYWNTLSADQRSQLKTRGYSTFDDMWNDVNGYNPSSQNGISGNIAYATTCGSRYLTRDNPALDKKTAYDVSPFVILAGLLPVDFYNVNNVLSFTSSKTTSHMIQPSSNTKFSTLEGMPHNKVHNYIGGVGPLDPGPYGNMTNFLSPVDPIFFLHHSNMDRLWDIWTRKQKALGLPYLPPKADLATLSDEAFLFYVNGSGGFVGPSKAGEYLSTERFNYDYAPGFGEDVIPSSNSALSAAKKPSSKVSVKGEMKGKTGSVAVPRAAVNEHLAAEAPTLMAEVTVERPSPFSMTREFDVIVGAPEGVTKVDADSPFFAGTVAFTGFMRHGMMDHDMPETATFAVPLPKRREAFKGLEAAQVSVNIRVVPTQGKGKPTPLKAVAVRSVQ